MTALARLALVATAAPASDVSAQAAAAVPPPAPYHVAKQIAAGGEGGWDYLAVDTAAHRVYLSRGTHVMVFDLAG